MLSEIDIAKLLVVAQRSLIWIALLFITSLASAFLYFRYTKPIFQSYSILKLDLKSDAGVLGFKNFKDETVQQSSKQTTISGEIELIKSRLVFEKVIEKRNLAVSCFSYGKILFEEEYNNSPIHVDFQIYNQSFFDKHFDFKF
jgi:tyrosine-protein kinase Etk/Wzc